MRRTLLLSIPLLTAAALAFGTTSHAGDKERPKKDEKTITVGKKTVEVAGEITEDDPIDKATKHRSTSYKVKLTEGKTYRIDMVSTEMDSFLRLEDAKGKQLAADDDGGGFPNARIVQKIDETGEYRVIATTFDGKTGKFTLTIREADAGDALLGKLKSLAKLSAEERKQTLAEAKKALVREPGKVDAQMANTLLGAAVNLEFGGQRDGPAVPARSTRSSASCSPTRPTRTWPAAAR